MLRRGAKPHLPFSQVWQADMWGQRRLSVYSNRETLRKPLEGCQAITPGPHDPELGFRGREAKVGIPSQRKEEERATNSGQGRGAVWETEPEGRKQASRERRAVWSVQRTVCLEGQVGGSMQGGRGQYGQVGRGLPRGRAGGRLGVGTGDMSAACDPRRGAWPAEWGWG